MKIKELLAKIPPMPKGLAALFAQNKPANGGASEKKKGFALPKELAIDVRMQEMSRYFSSNVLVEKALVSLDKSVLLIIGVSWCVALAAVGLAFMGVREATALKIKLETARALEPFLPKINRILLTKDQYAPLLVRLKKQFPDVQFEITGKPSLRIYSNKSEEFVDWLNAVSYTDSIVPSIRWSMTTFCVGPECAGDFVMQAELVAETINIAKPEQ